MAHLKMDKNGNVQEVGFDGSVNCGLNLKLEINAVPCIQEEISDVATEAAPVGQTVLSDIHPMSQYFRNQVVNPSTNPKEALANIFTWLKSVFMVKEVKSIPQSEQVVQATPVVTADATEYTVTTESAQEAHTEESDASQVLPTGATVVTSEQAIAPVAAPVQNFEHPMAQYFK